MERKQEESGEGSKKGRGRISRKRMKLREEEKK